MLDVPKKDKHPLLGEAWILKNLSLEENSMSMTLPGPLLEALDNMQSSFCEAQI
jgi:hypothetical protein